MRGRVLWLAAALATLAVGACGGSDGGGGGASEKPAKLTVYSGRDEELVAPLFKRFERRTGIPVEVRYGDTAELAATLVEEGDRSPADVFFGQDAGALGALEKAGRLAELPQATLARVDERFRSPSGRWVGTSGRVRVVAYDTRRLDPEDLPASILDFTDRRWKGKIGWAPTNASFQAFVTALRKVEGEDRARAWLRGIKRNDAKAYEKNSLVRDAIANGEIQVGFINHYYVLEAKAKEGADYPVGLYFPKGGDAGSLINVAGGGVLASSKNRQAAQRLIDFLLSQEAQRYFAQQTKEYPLSAGVQPDPELPKLSAIEQPNVRLNDLDDLQGTLRLIEDAGVL